MPHYKITGYRSHRHPLLGYESTPLGLDVQPALAAEAAPEPTLPSLSKIARPFVWGAAAGVLVYSLARSFSVDRRKAMQTAFVYSGINIVAGLATDYLFREVAAVQEAPVPGEVAPARY